MRHGDTVPVILFLTDFGGLVICESEIDAAGVKLRPNGSMYASKRSRILSDFLTLYACDHWLRVAR